MDLQPYQIRLKLRKEFIQATHNHPILTAKNRTYGAFYSRLESRDDIEISWGGLNGSQFSSIEEFSDFLKAFKALLKRKKICSDHCNNLLYFVNIFEDQAEEDSKDNNEYNHTLELSKMLIDLMSIKLTELKPENERIFFDSEKDKYFIVNDQSLESIPKDQYPRELFYSLPLQVIVDNKYSHTKHLPQDLTITFKSKSISSNMKRMPITEITVPSSHVQAITELIIKYSLDQAKKFDAPIYKAFKEQRLDRDTLKKIYEMRRILNLSWNDAIVRVGIIVRDYLKDNTMLTTWYQQANFLFEYFALFKVYRPKKRLPDFPTRYSDVIKYYKKCNLSHKTIETMFRDSNFDVGGNKL